MYITLSGTYFVVGSSNTNGRPVERVALEVAKAGISVIQLREKNSQGNSLDAGQVYESAVQILDEFGKLEHKPLFLINDRVDVAIALHLNGYQVDGVHIGQQDLLPADVRNMFNKIGFHNAIIGLSCRTEAALNRAADCYKSGAINYVGIGPVHSTNSKLGLPEGLGYEHWGELCQFVKHLVPELPVFAIGGLTPEDAKPLKHVQADGYCCISYIAGAPDIATATKEFVKHWEE
jgi:thiamine-phosphate diphosphorylase